MKATQAWIQSVVEAVQAPLLVMEGTTGVIVEANAEAIRLYGYDRATLLGKTESDLRVPDPCANSRRDRAIIHQNHNGQHFPVRLTDLNPPVTPRGKKISYRMITACPDLVRVGRPFSEAGCLYQSILEDQTEFICRIKADGTFLYANEGYGRYFGKKVEDLIGQKWHPLAHPDDIPQIEESLASMTKANPVVVIENRIFLPDGSVRTAQFTNHGIFDEDGKLKEVQSVGRDITDIKSAKKALEESERRFRAIFDSTFQFISLIKPDGTVLEVNGTALKFSRLTREDVVDKLFWEIPWPGMTDSVREKIKQAVPLAASGQLVRFNIEIHSVTGQRVTMDFTIKPVIDASGHVVLLIPEASDITASRHQEEERMQASKLEALGVLAGGIAHDLNNIMMCISLSLELIRLQAKRGVLSDDGIADALKNVKRASDLSNRLLTFAKGGDPVMTHLDIGDVVASALNLALRGSNLVPVVKSDANLPPVLGDRGLLSQVIDHLVINAREATPQGGSLYVTLAAVQLKEGEEPLLPAGSYVRIDVQDEGNGILPENLHRIFDPYFSTKPTGTGIGLTTCFSIVRRHHGGISARSVPGQGAAFTIYLPSATEKKASAGTGAPAAGTALRGSGKVLIIDDDPELREGLSQILQLTGFQATIADKGETGFALYRKAKRQGAPFDVVLIDATIKGGKGGVDALELLRRADPKVRAIIMSGYTHSNAMADWQENGFRSMLRKPFTTEKVVEVLNRICAES